jgi:peroxiredoxin
MTRQYILLGILALLAAAAGLYYWLGDPFPEDPNYVADYRKIRFRDDPAWNEAADVDVARMRFVDRDGKEVALSKIAGQGSLTLVITRGNTEVPCIYCSTQTSRLVSQYQEFTKRHGEVVVVYPVQAGPDVKALEKFLQATREKLDDPRSKVPFPIVFDTQLRVVDQLGLRENLAKPATYILDKHGQVRFAYVGSVIADRPSVKAMLEQLDTLNREAQ